jgi:hypothetical protein
MLSYSAKLNLTEAQKKGILKVLAWEQDSFNQAAKILWESKDLGIMPLHRSLYKKFREKHKNCPSQVITKGIGKLCKHPCLEPGNRLFSGQAIVNRPKTGICKDFSIVEYS